MNKLINNNTLLLHPGTSQNQRFPQALDKQYVRIDERLPEDLLQFIQQYAQLIQYYQENHQPDGDWSAFFAPGEVPSSTPHLALFRTFLDLFRNAQDQLNTLTQAHLDFYYRQVLRLYERPAIADQVHVTFALAENREDHLIKAGTLLNAGQDATGVDLTYQIDQDLLVNSAKVESVKSIFVDSDHHSMVYAAPVANSMDGQGQELEGEEPKWRIFGESQHQKSSSERTMVDAQIGFALASPILFLAEGQRTITLRLSFTNEVPNLLPDAFRVLFSGEKQWIAPDSIQVARVLSNALEFTLTLNPEHPAVVAYQAENLGGNFSTSWPLIQVFLNPDALTYPYAALKDLQLTRAAIHVDVQGVRDLILQNDNGPLDVGNPVAPFGTRPVLGSAFYIGSQEVFQKKLDQVELILEWHDLPADLGAHYQAYSNQTITPTDFQASLARLENRQWQEIGEYPLFNTVGGSATKTMTATANLGVTRQPHLPQISELDQNTQSGFIRLSLSQPTTPWEAFGHKEYPFLYTQQSIALSQYVFVEGNSPTDPAAPQLPLDPYTPVLKSVALNYTSQVTFDLSTFSQVDPVEQFFHLEAFGQRAVPVSQPPQPLSLLPQYQAGEFFLGIKNLHPLQNLSLLFQLADGSANPEITIKPQDIRWSYLTDQHWRPLTDLQIPSDTTFGLNRSGMMTFAWPKDAVDDNPILPKGQHWLRAAIKKNAADVSQIIAIQAQAMSASFLDNQNDSQHLARPLPAHSIRELSISDPAISAVEQPFASFGGKPKEQQSAFLTRVSERLRHKGRAITCWDYERLILEEFPSVHKVKCLNHNRQDDQRAPSWVSLIVVPDLRNKNAVNPLTPRVESYTLGQIQQYLQPLICPWVNLQVKNPVYEEILLDFSVTFRPGFDPSFYGRQLNEEIKRYLAPWAFDEGADIPLGGQVYRSVLLHFVETRDYVDYLLEFQLRHIVAGIESEPVEVAVATGPRSVLVSSNEHRIKI